MNITPNSMSFKARAFIKTTDRIDEEFLSKRIDHGIETYNIPENNTYRRPIPGEGLALFTSNDVEMAKILTHLTNSCSLKQKSNAILEKMAKNPKAPLRFDSEL